MIVRTQENSQIHRNSTGSRTICSKKFEISRDKNENKIHQNLWDTANAKIGWEFTAVLAFIVKEERFLISNLTLQFKELK